jgi:hypothetical protein
MTYKEGRRMHAKKGLPFMGSYALYPLKTLEKMKNEKKK